MMDVAKKTQREQYIIVGLLVLFAVTFVTGPMKHLGFFRKPQNPTPPATIKFSRPLTETLKEHERQMEVVQVVQPAAGSTKPTGEPKYTAQTLRDPLKSLLPAVTSSTPTPGGPPTPTAQEPAPFNPPLVQGMWWGSSKPRAIINSQLLGVGDHIDGATIVAIGRDGVTLDHAGEIIRVTPRMPQAASSEGGMSAR